jgi:Ca-activated chloride channel family protein
MLGENLIEAARRRARQRRLRTLVGAVAVVAAVGVGAVLAFRASGPAHVAPPREVTLVIDVSGSMRANDVKPTRLAAAVDATRSFVDGLPSGVRVAVVVFSDGTKVVQAPTDDRARLSRALGSLAPESGTALGSGLAAAVRLTRATLGSDIVLVSDGSQNRGRTTPIEAARLAKAAGIPVYTVALGTPRGTVTFGDSGISSAHIRVPPDPNVVRMIAGATGGEAFVAQTSAQLGHAFADMRKRLDG